VTGRHIIWEKVAGHAGVAGNERCDDIATGFADDVAPHLYVGPLSSYQIDLSVSTPTKKPTKKSSSAKAYSYLSLVDGVLEKHQTWTECEARVKGVKGARFKKAFSPSDEDTIASEWGVN
jgi:ribonuclease HI